MLKLLLLSILVSSGAYANEGKGQMDIMNFVPMILIFFIFYFLMIRPQKKQLDEEKEMLENLQKGTEVFTKSGIIGTVVGLTDKVVTLEVAKETKIKFLKSQIGGLSSKIFAKEDNK